MPTQCPYADPVSTNLCANHENSVEVGSSLSTSRETCVTGVVV